LIILGLLASKARVVNRNYLRASLLLQLFALILSVTRGAWIGLFLGVFLLIWLLVQTEKKWGMPFLKAVSFLLLIVLIAVVLVYSFSSSVTEDVVNRMTSLKTLDFNVDSRSTESVRFSRMQRVAQIIKSRLWLGYGPGQAGFYSEVFSWFDIEDDYLRRGAGAANIFLSVLFQRGVLGLAVIGVFLVIFLLRTVRALPRIRDDAQRAVLRSVFLGFCGVLMTFMFTENHLLAFFWVQMGFILAVQDCALSPQTNSPAGGPT
jgi:O-antigen ligase